MCQQASYLRIVPGDYRIVLSRAMRAPRIAQNYVARNGSSPRPAGLFEVQSNVDPALLGAARENHHSTEL